VSSLFDKPFKKNIKTKKNYFTTVVLKTDVKYTYLTSVSIV